MTLRLTSSSLAGTSRKLVAVGTARLRSMLATISGAGAADRARRASAAVAGGRRGGAGSALRPAPAPARRGAAPAAGAARRAAAGSARALGCRRVR